MGLAGGCTTRVQQQPAGDQRCTRDGDVAPCSAGSLSGPSRPTRHRSPVPFPRWDRVGVQGGCKHVPRTGVSTPGAAGSPMAQQSCRRGPSASGAYDTPNPFTQKALRLGDPASRTGPNAIVTVCLPREALVHLHQGLSESAGGGAGTNTTQPKSCSQVSSSATDPG